MSSAPVVSTQTPTPTSTSHTVRKRDGSIVSFDAERIRSAISKAFHAEFEVAVDDDLPPQLAAKVASLTAAVLAWCDHRVGLQVERIQDQVERVLMTAGEHRVARRYVLYREQRASRRRGVAVYYRRADGVEAPLDMSLLQSRIEAACAGLATQVVAAPVFEQTIAQLYPGITEAEITQAAIMAARARIELEPDYSFVAARLLLEMLRQEALGQAVAVTAASASSEQGVLSYRAGFGQYVERAVTAGLLDPAMLDFDLTRLAEALEPSRDL